MPDKLTPAQRQRCMSSIRRKEDRKAWRQERDRMLERQAALEAEILRMYPIPRKVRKAAKEE